MSIFQDAELAAAKQQAEEEAIALVALKKRKEDMAARKRKKQKKVASRASACPKAKPSKELGGREAFASLDLYNKNVPDVKYDGDSQTFVKLMNAGKKVEGARYKEASAISEQDRFLVGIVKGAERIYTQKRGGFFVPDSWEAGNWSAIWNWLRGIKPPETVGLAEPVKNRLEADGYVILPSGDIYNSDGTPTAPAQNVLSPEQAAAAQVERSEEAAARAAAPVPEPSPFDDTPPTTASNTPSTSTAPFEPGNTWYGAPMPTSWQGSHPVRQHELESRARLRERQNRAKHYEARALLSGAYDVAPENTRNAIYSNAINNQIRAMEDAEGRTIDRNSPEAFEIVQSVLSRPVEALAPGHKSIMANPGTTMPTWALESINRQRAGRGQAPLELYSNYEIDSGIVRTEPLNVPKAAPEFWYDKPNAGTPLGRRTDPNNSFGSENQSFVQSAQRIGVPRAPQAITPHTPAMRF